MFAALHTQEGCLLAVKEIPIARTPRQDQDLNSLAREISTLASLKVRRGGRVAGREGWPVYLPGSRVGGSEPARDDPMGWRPRLWSLFPTPGRAGKPGLGVGCCDHRGIAF